MVHGFGGTYYDLSHYGLRNFCIFSIDSVLLFFAFSHKKNNIKIKNIVYIHV